MENPVKKLKFLSVFVLALINSNLLTSSIVDRKKAVTVPEGTSLDISKTTKETFFKKVSPSTKTSPSMTVEDTIEKEIQAKIPEINFDQEIVFGQSAFLEKGPLKIYGELIRNAILARFKRENEHGGINNKTLRLVSINDFGDPQTTFKNIKVMKKNKIDMFVGNMGTRSTMRILPLVEKKEIALLFPWADDERLRDSSLSHLINGPGFMQRQINQLVKYATKKLQLDKIAIFYEDSLPGKSNKDYFTKKLAENGITPAATASYNMLTSEIEQPAKTLIKSNPKLVVCMTTSMPAVKMINEFLESGHYGTSFIGTDSTLFVSNILRKKGVPFAYASNFPNPSKSNVPIIKNFREDMLRFFPKDGQTILSLAHYIHADIIINALKKITGKVTKEKVIEQIEKMKQYDLGGFTINFNKDTRQAYTGEIHIIKGQS